MKAVSVSLTNATDCFVALPSHLACSLHSQTNRFPPPVALKLKWIDNETDRSKIAYVGWSGSSSASRSSIEIGEKFAQSIGLAASRDRASTGISLLNCDTVDITPIVPKDASTIQIEPVSEDDWEIMELNAGYLEEQIRNQIAIIFNSELFPLHIHQRTILHLRVVGVEPKGGSGTECLRLHSGSEFIVTPKPRKKEQEEEIDTEEEQEPVTHRSCLLRVQPGKISLKEGNFAAYLNPNTMKALGWKQGCLVSITALQKPFSFELLDQQIRQGSQHHPETSKLDKQATTKKHRTVHCKIEESTRVQEQQIVLPLFARLQCLIEERTRVLIRYVSPSSKSLKRVFPTKIQLQEIRWHQTNTNEPSTRLNSTNLSPKQVLEGFLGTLEEKMIWETEKLLLFRLPDDSADQIPRSFLVTIEPPIDKCSFLKTEAIIKRKDIIDIAPRLSLTLPNFCNLQEEFNGKEENSEKTLGGFEIEQKKLSEFLTPIMMKRKYKQRLFPTPIPPMAIVTGKHGAGKSSLVRSVIQVFRKAPYYVYFHYIHFEVLLHRNIHTLQRYVSETIQLARLNQPAVVVLENIDAVVTTDQQGEYTILAEQLSEFLVDLMSEIAEDAQQVAFIMTTTAAASTHKSLRAAHIANIQIELQAPTPQQRVNILKALTEQKHVIVEEENILQVSKRCEGYLPADLEQLLDRAIHQCSFRCLGISQTDLLSETTNKWKISSDDFLKAQEAFTPASLKGIKFVKSDKTWEDVGALDEVKHLLKETFEWPTRFEKLFEKCPLKLRRGLLLYGPPGCGKTLIASAVAQECNLNFISVKGPELLNKYIGASEQAVRDLFEQAAAAKPCILFFDEFDSIAPRRGHDNTGVTDRVVNQLLTQLDGVESISSVYVLAATSRPDLIDPALLRPGRLDKCLYCGIPSEEERTKILHAVSSKVQLSPDVSLEEIAAMTNGYTGADLHALLHNAQLEVVHQIIDQQKESLQLGDKEDKQSEFTHNMKIVELGQSKMSKAEKAQLERRIKQFSFLENRDDSEEREKESPMLLVTLEHILRAFDDLRPSVTPAEKRKYEAIYADFLSSRGAGAKPATGLQKATQA